MGCGRRQLSFPRSIEIWCYVRYTPQNIFRRAYHESFLIIFCENGNGSRWNSNIVFLQAECARVWEFFEGVGLWWCFGISFQSHMKLEIYSWNRSRSLNMRILLKEGSEGPLKLITWRNFANLKTLLLLLNCNQEKQVSLKQNIPLQTY